MAGKVPRWRLLILFILGTGLHHVFYAQGTNLGTPPIRNFSKKEYRGGTQNWDVAQDERRMLYWANNDGLLRYDGTSWQCFPVPNRTIVRSVAIHRNGRIYTGAQSEIGYFEPGSNGRLTYQSLLLLLPEDQRNFEDVWDIIFFGDDVFFRTNKLVFQYTGERLHIHQPGGDLHALFATSSALILQQSLHELLEFKGSSFTIHRRMEDLGSPITGVFPWAGDTTLMTTLKHGIFFLTAHGHYGAWTTPYDTWIKEKRIYSSTLLPGSFIALGTSLDGLIVMDQHRRIYRHLYKKHGLQNNNILNCFADQSGNLWLGLDNGIDMIVFDSRYHFVFPDEDLHATGYAASLQEGKLYLGVSNGTYVAPWQTYYPPMQEPLFVKAGQSDGQVWSLNLAGGRLLMGHHEGAFELVGDAARRIGQQNGVWTFVPLQDDYLMAGTYEGLALYKKTPQGWTYDGMIRGLDESCRILVRDADGAVWVSHPYRGLYHVRWTPFSKFDPEITYYNHTHGLPSHLNNYVFRIAGKAVFGTERGVYHFDPQQKRFVPDPDFNLIFGKEHRIKYMKEDPQGNIWYATDEEAGRLRVKDFGVKKEVQKQVFPELHGRLAGGFEFIYPIDPHNVIIGTEEGFIHLNPAVPYRQDTTLHLILTNVTAFGKTDSVLFGGYPASSATGDQVPVLASGMNHLNFTYSATDFKDPTLLRYRTRLAGLEDEWSSWTTESRRSITNLNPGKYTFEVQAAVKHGIESEIVRFAFRIKPPWYTSGTAILLYSLSVMGLFAGFVMRQRHRFESEKAQLTETHQQKEAEQSRMVEASRAALTEIQNEKLEVEIKYKNQELALTTMHLVQKAEILLGIKDGLLQLQEKSKNPEIKKDLQQLLNLLNFDVKLDEDWAQFAFHFDQVHVDFLKHLREAFPQLSTNDCKLCAYLRMNLSTKDIAPLLNISVRGVEGSRYRLRKKLGLPNDANLTDFILNLTPSGDA